MSVVECEGLFHAIGHCDTLVSLSVECECAGLGLCVDDRW
jgi:hypothetical protein